MTSAVIVALIAAAPPTLAALVTYLQARAAQRAASEERKSATERTLEVLGAAIDRLQVATDRIDGGVADLRERVGRLEGGLAGGTSRRLRA